MDFKTVFEDLEPYRKLTTHGKNIYVYVACVNCLRERYD